MTSRGSPGRRRGPRLPVPRPSRRGRSPTATERSRIESLAIPPAWTDVWICPIADGHIQATGRDARGRKQYRYHPRWREVRDETKYDRMIAFGRALPRIRGASTRDLRRPGAAAREGARHGRPPARDDADPRRQRRVRPRRTDSFGLTTLRDRHVEHRRPTHPRSASAARAARCTRSTSTTGALAARSSSACQDLPGQELFQYLDEDGEPADVDSDDVNDYLREVAGDDFTAKDFRTWAGTVLAALALEELERVRLEAQAKTQRRRGDRVGRRASSGNTPAVCRKCYVHPDVIDAYLDGTLRAGLRKRPKRELSRDGSLSRHEAAVLSFLERRR